MPLSCKKDLRFMRGSVDFLNMTGPAIDAGLVLAVTSQAPSHLETGCAGDPLHGRHFAVTGGTGDSGTDMHHVREIDMVRQAVDPDPLNRLLLVPVGHQLLDSLGLRGDIEMAGPALRHRRDA